MSKRKLFIAAIIVAAAFVSVPIAFSVFWDGYFTNLLVKGILRPQGQMQYRVVELSGTSPAGYSIGETTSGIIFTVDPTTYPGSSTAAKVNDGTDECAIGIAGAGVTVTVAPSTSATGDRILGVQNTGGTTGFVVHLTGDVPIQTSSGTTPEGVFDAEGDIVWLRLPYNGAVSAYVIDQRIQ